MLRRNWQAGATVVTTLATKIVNDWSLNLAGMIAYSLITAIFPILLFILSIVSVVVQAFAPSRLSDIAGAINSVFPPQARQAGIDVTPLLHSLVQFTGPIAAVALIGLLWLGSNLFVSIENAFSIVFRVRGRDPVPQRLVAFGMVLLLTLMLPISVAAASLAAAGSQAFRTVLPQEVGKALVIVGPLTSLAVSWLLFLVIYLVVPNFDVQFRQAWRGALTAAVLFEIVQLLFPLYFAVFLYGNLRYGAAAASLLLFIIWLWFFAVATVIGAQINAVAIGLKPSPYDLARTFEMAYEQQDVLVGTKRNTAPRFGRIWAWLRSFGVRRSPRNLPPGGPYDTT